MKFLAEMGGYASMLNPAEHKLRTAAMVVTAFMLIQLAWGGLRLLLVSPPDPVMPVASSLRAAVVDVEALDATQAGSDIVTRPVFWQGRKAFTAEAPVVNEEKTSTGKPAANDPITKTRLLGVFGDGSRRGVIIKHGSERKRLMQGEALDGWVLAYMSGASVIFEKGEMTHTVDLKHAVPEQKGKSRGKK